MSRRFWPSITSRAGGTRARAVETIHPFDDGNGRTGRALVHVIFRRRGIAPRFLPPISVIFAGARDRYIAALSRFRFDENGVADWIEHFAAATVRAARLAQAYVTAVWRAPGAVARPAALDRYRTPRRRGGVGDYRSSTRAPEISAPVATAAAGRAKSRVYEGIEQLVSTGVLLPLSEGKRNRWWEAGGLLDLIARLEAGELPPDT